MGRRFYRLVLSVNTLVLSSSIGKVYLHNILLKT